MHKIKKILFYILLFYTIFGFFILPFIVKSQIIKEVASTTYAKASIDSVYINPFLFKIELHDFVLYDQRKKSLVSLKSLCFDVEPHSLINGTIHLRELLLEEPNITLIIEKNKSINLLSILKPSTTSKQSQETDTSQIQLPHILLDSIKIVDGSIAYKDFTHINQFDFILHRIGFTIKDIDTRTKNRDNGKIRLYATLGDGGFIDLKTTLESFTPLAFHGSLDFEASKLYTQWRYVQDMLNLEVADGKISLHTHFKFNLNELNATKITDTRLALENLRIKPKGKKKDILHLKKLVVRSSMFSPLKHKGVIEKVALNGLNVQVQREVNGSIDWLEYVKIKNATSTQTQDNNVTEKGQPWDVDVHEISLENLALAFNDASIHPHVTSTMDKLMVHIYNLNSLGKQPFTYTVTTLINQSTPCQFDGKLAFANIDILTHTQCNNFNIVHYNPYIDQVIKQNFQRFNVDLKRLYTSIEATTHLYDKNGSFIAIVEDANVSIDKCKINKKTTQKPLVTMRSFQVHHASIDTKEKNIYINDVLLDRFTLYLQRYKNTKLNIDNLVVAKNVAKHPKQEKPKKQKEKGYHLSLKTLHVKHGKILFRDNALAKVQKHSIDRIDIVVHNIDSKKGSWLRYKTTLRINKKGKLYARGKLRASPLQERGYFSLKYIELNTLTPYLQEGTYLDIYDGRISMQGRTLYAPSKATPDLQLKGNFRIDSLFINNTKDNSFLFSMNKFFIQSYTLELFPNRLYIDAIDINSFYVNAKIDEKKVLNFSTLVKESSEKNNTTEEQVVQKKDPFPISIVKVSVENGSAKFSDFSIPIKFKTDIHDLNGVVYAISNTPNETTYINIKGEVDKYGSTLLKGSLDASNPKKYTDIDFNFKNLDLNSLSGYSAEFAGYKIDSGKLFLDLGYDINEGELLGSNSVIIKKMKLGDAIEDENITHLPLGFVIGLLEDSDGIIDIDMPVEGNVDNPDFKYGALIFKTFTNLIAKAVTSPFKFLGSMLGMDGEDLEFVVFEANSIVITPPQREKLDKLAKMMIKRPKITLHVRGAYDKKTDTLALQKEKLIALVMQKSGDNNLKDKENTLAVTILEAIYKKHFDAKKLESLQTALHKKYKKEDVYKRMYQKELVTRCSSIQKISQKELEELGHKRARAILQYLSDEKQINKARLSLAKENIISDEKEGVMVKMEIEIKKVK